ncbi:beta-propeller fold lactonase family protein [Amycolatopsis rhabdoformis]|uniref:Beta-propeller fold lactonase family protein n=1 Tax=Amycolatopsis rhabdoformis TaxID=1448059 RepID=A0ABZ1I0Z3_9PSEU|nr:beta-propeller fold lactonase family protein [Amycolatopsis rhabdoformis]WSE28077.1 beta-propeller fold lactonase family protein [Amycolatopsis rhabdoformis]
MTDVLLVGCYTAEMGGKGTGISTFRRDPAGLVLESTLELRSPSWLVKHPTLPVLYTTNETDDGAVSSVSLVDGALAVLDAEVPSGGAHPCHLAVTPDGRFLLCANYTGGSLAVFGLSADGRITGRTALVQHSGTGPNSARQESAHVHMAVPSADGSVVSAVDLGTDEIRSYTLSSAGELTLLAVSQLPPGSGPRQLVRIPGTDLAYVACELSSEVLTVRETSPGTFEVVAATPAVHGTFDGENIVAHLEVLDSGVYLSNRGADVVTAFSGSPLAAVADQACGAHPRHFAVVDGVCYVTAQSDDELTAFPLAELGQAEVVTIPTGSPSFVLPLSL